MSRSLSPHNTEQAYDTEKPLGGRYQVIRPLGTGGFGRTFLAKDLHLPGHPLCAVKQLKAQAKDDSMLQMARRCFETEAQVLYQLGSHSQIPQLLAHFEEDQEFYLAQEFIEGTPLTKELAPSQTWSQGRAIALIKDILGVLVFVHEQQVIHRDLKPSNLIRRHSDGRIVLIDFGAVKQVSGQSFDPDTGMTNITISIGTQGYMPNEQLAGKPRFSSDIYAVGIIGIQALTGLHPRRLGEDLRGELEWAHRVKEICPEFKDVLDCMVRYDFRDRYTTAKDALEALEAVPIDDLPTVPQLIPIVSAEPAEPAPLDDGASELISSLARSVEREMPVMLEFAKTDVELSHIVAPAQTAAMAVTPAVSAAVTEAMPPAKPEPTRSTVVEEPADSPERFAPFWSLVMAVAVSGVTITSIGAVLSSQILGQVLNRNSAVVPGSQLSTQVTDAWILPPERQASLFFRQAQDLKRTGQFEAALARYDQAIAAKPDLAEAYAGRCDTLNRLQRPDEAIVACNDAIAYEPNYAEAIWSKGNAYVLKGRVYEALQLYDRVTRIKPDFADGWVKHGVALQKLGRSAEALNSLHRGIALYRDSVEAWTTQGEALLTLERYDDAVVAFDKALQLQPDSSRLQQLRDRARARL